ncbi:FISUMP domain-containing protein [Dysgonomonas sp. ZJ709]|uniref:FISUMP domain-containing protein n=1 Tax=Dysgonomonas sp. ZJ709 TaxID=2709797 RepID=UPI0013EAE835|nr:FISUMP domain-containing protein [Dysgonomonas sp. ZJ709]
MIYLTKLIFISLLALTSGLYAQVTIGSNIPPASGALLELKDKNAESGNLATSTKGLLMPRVSLTSLTNLYPMLTGSESDYATQKIAHVGLMVYNTNVCAPTPTGMNVWDGSKWQLLGNELLSANVKIYKDQDGNSFKAATFGSAGVWMTQNLAAKNYAPSMGGGAIPVHTSGTDSTIVAYAYPNGSSANWSSAPSTWSPNQGLLYSWFAAAKGNTSIAIDQQVIGAAVEAFEVEMVGPLGTAPNKYVQGVCPDGWHLPSDREWNQLEQEIYNNAGAYSSSSTSNFSPTSWVVDWGGEPTRLVYMNVYRGSSTAFGHGTAMKSGCAPSAGISTNTNGTSKTLAEGGFNSLLVGSIDGATSLNYGSRIYFWTSSSGSQNIKAGVSVYRNLAADNVRVGRGNTNRRHLWSVRCKKN